MTEAYENKNLIVLCEHCLTKVAGSSRFCTYCDSEPKRQKMDFENSQLFESKQIPFTCQYHIKKQLEKERQIQLNNNQNANTPIN